MKESQIREHIAKGWIRAIVTFEVVGKPAKHVEQALAEYIENIKKDSRIIILQEEREEALEHEDGMFSTFSEAELLVKDLETFTWLCINFSPASIEIIKPEELVVEGRDITNWLNDLLAKLHEIATGYRNAKNAHGHMTVALNELIMNAILLSLKQGIKTAKDIEKDTGIVTDQLDPFLKHLVEKKRIALNGKSYSLDHGSAEKARK